MIFNYTQSTNPTVLKGISITPHARRISANFIGDKAMKTKYKNNSKIMEIIGFVAPIIIIAGFLAIGLQNYFYNNTERVHDFSAAQKEGTSFVFDDITVDIATRGGDTGSWVSDAIFTEDGTAIYDSAVGTIYEMTVINNTSDSIPKWQAVVYIPENMFINNTWNGDVEFHQNVKSGNENVQLINLSQFSKYDITLENFTTSFGPMLKLYEGDYFIYYPDELMKEAPIPAKPSDPNDESSVKTGFIMYIPDRSADYIADFSRGEIRYQLNASIFNNPVFWVLCALTVAWISYIIAMVIVKMNMKRFVEQKKRDEETIEQIMRTFINFIEAKDPSTMGHSVRVAQYSKVLAEKLGFSEDECTQIYHIGLMHDCGKIYIPDEILSKPGKLTDEEYEIMKKHTIYGNDILRDFTAIDNMGTGALSHHERYDGKGYPNGIAGEDIPIISRIICVSDAFDAMNSRRCYRDNLSEEVIISELKNNKGKQFDPNIVDSLLSLINDGIIPIGANR